MEETLFSSDLGTKTTKSVLQKLRTIVDERKYNQVEDLKAALKEALYHFITSETMDCTLKTASEPPTVVLLVGSNGMGKTTSIGKLGYQYMLQGKKLRIY